MSSNNDPIQPIRQLLINFMSEVEIDPMEAMTALVQGAAKIAHDSATQDNLSPADNRDRWMGGCMLAFDAVDGGKILDGPQEPARHLSLCAGVGKGSRRGIKHRREKNKAARKSRRSQR